MIFVTVGNPTQGFSRLLNSVVSLKSSGRLHNEPVFVQSGNNTGFRSDWCESKPFLSMDEFQNYLEKADVIVSHGGCGTLLNAIRIGKIAVVMPRRKKYGEHVNDHQLQLVEALAKEGKAIPAYEPEDLPGAIEEARKQNSGRSKSRVESNGKRKPMLDLVDQAIRELMK